MKFIKCLAFLILTLLLANSQVSFAQGNEDELLALQYFNDGEFDKAVVIYERLYKKDPSIYFYNYYFECLLALEQYSKADKLVQGLVKKNPAVFRYQVDQGLIYAAQGDQKKADKSFADAIAAVKPTEDNYSALAQYFMFRQLMEWTTKTYETAIAKIPETISLRYELSNMYFQSRRTEEMFELFYWLLDHPMVGVNDVQQRLIAYFARDYSETMKNDFVGFAMKKAQRNSQNNNYAEMLLWAYLQVSDFQKALNQAFAMDRRQKADGQVVLGLVPVLVQNKEFDKAIEGLMFVIEKGENSVNYNVARTQLFDVRYEKAASFVPADIMEMRKLEQEIIAFLEETGVHAATLNLVMKLASVQAFYLDNPDDAKIWLEKAMAIPRISALYYAELKILLADVMLLTGEHWDASLLYSQVEKDFKHDTIGFRAKFKNAQFYFYIGEFDYALTHLKILRSATSKLIANDAMELSLFISNNIDYDSSYVPLGYYSRAEFLWKCKSPLEAMSALDSLLNIFPVHPIRDDAHMLKAKVFIEMKQYDNAVLSLKNIVQSHYFDLLADDALFMLAGLYENKLNDIEQAMECYWNIVNDFPSSIFASESREKYRQLRENQSTP